MKKQDLISLIRAHCEGDEAAFRRLANDFANEFFANGEDVLGREIAAYLSSSCAFVPQESSVSSSYFKKVSEEELSNASVFWPDAIYEDVKGVASAIKRRNGVSKFIFYGKSGTGKTETAKALARVSGCELWIVDFPSLVDYKLGETAKNITDMFKQISGAKNQRKLIFLFDEIDSIALDRVDSNDLREMGRATSAFLRGIEELPPDVCIIATTNLYEKMDQALIRRFDASIDFNRYDRESLIDVSKDLYSSLIGKEGDLLNDSKLFTKILEASLTIPFPGEMKNLIRTCIAFGGDDPANYLRLILKKLNPSETITPIWLSNKGFTVREAALLAGISKSSVARRLKDE